MIETTKIKKHIKLLITLVLVTIVVIFSHTTLAKNTITVEEQRIKKAHQTMPDVVNRLNKNIINFQNKLTQSQNIKSLTKLVNKHANSLWESSIISFNSMTDFDDRPLYWARLQMTRALRLSTAYTELTQKQQQQLQWQLELISRGKSNVLFDKKANKKILITGFDPFFLDRHINQSNPSGVAALALDDLLISLDGKTAEVESLIVPVRFSDFNQGMIEELLTPYFKKHSVDMIITISMGRDHFDLERFPGLRRSAKALDNLNVYTGANDKSPLVPMLKDKPLAGPEFLEFSLPVEAMIKTYGTFNINDNHEVTTLEKTFSPLLLKELDNQISVNGSGGGYLSNEISYRSILLRNKFWPKLPVGHIHTPRFKGFEPKKSKIIVTEIKAMITRAVAEL